MEEEKEENNFTEFLIKRKYRRRKRKDPYKSNIKHSNSDTNFILHKENEFRDEIEENMRLKSKTVFKKMSHSNHKHSSRCKYCTGFHKLIKREENILSAYIENNVSFLTLLGNPRYNKTSPFLFVEDHKNNLSEKTMGLMPIPVKKNRTKSVVNKSKLYNLQRGIVMVRRYQYGRKNFFQALTYRSYDVTLIQKWWKNVGQIIMIQKMFRGYFIRKQVTGINNLHKFMNNFEKIVIRLKKAKFMRNILLKITIRKNRKYIKGNFISKRSYICDYTIRDKIICIQKYIRKYETKINFKKLLRNQKYFVANKDKALVTKKYYKIKGIYEQISIIQFNVRKYLTYKNYFSFKNLHNKGIGTFYIDKNYVNGYFLKVINFYNIMVHRLRLIAMKKIRSNYKYVNEYNKEDINKVIFIQRIYLSHYYNKYPKKLKCNKKLKKIGIIDRIRLKDNLKQIEFIQNIFRKYNLRIAKFNKKLVRNKPISSPKIKKGKENQLNNKSNKKEKSIYNYKNLRNIKKQKIY